jgi:hypothetical protein
MARLTKDVPVWEKWGPNELKRKREEIGSREFDRGWRQRAISSDQLLIQPAHIDACKNFETELLYPGDPDCEIYSKGKWSTFMGVDLAIAGTEKAGDFFVITVIAVERPSFKRHLVGVYRQRGLTFKSQLEVVQQHDEAWSPTLVCVENVAYQDAFVQELQRTTPIPVHPFATSAINKHNLESGLPRLAVEIEQTRWSFPWAEGKTRDVVGMLTNEMINYGVARHDDMLMSLFFARIAATQVKVNTTKRVRVI